MISPRKIVSRAMTCCLLAMAAPQAASAQADRMTFQGLSGRSGKADVLKAFPKAIPEDKCRPGQSVQISSEGEAACVVLELPSYRVDGIDFEVTFTFSAEGRLRYVHLMKSGDTDDQDGLRRTFRSLTDLVATKYGPAVSDPPGAFLQRKDQIGELEWQPGRGSKWQSGGDRLTVSADCWPNKQPSTTCWGIVSIFYRFGRVDEANKL